ncbi:MAG: ribonuclease E/G, partial [Propylenella sp.]
LTLRSTAPKLVYEEGSLIKRSIRDLYSREIEQVIVAGEDAYREAKDFMRMLMPSHARNVQVYKDTTPIFSRNGVEAQLDAMFSPQVTLRSGGYVVINQTEALVSIDVNSGRSTREHSIEDTALKTNLEAAEEIARQLRLRDLAGLIVIDFIDMEEKRNNRAVERKLKDCLRADRARIQVGRISHFGLLEMSRQRIRTGVLESSTVPCPHCRGTGQVRSVSSLSLQILRALEEQLFKHNTHHLLVRTRPEVGLYVLNQKRRHLAELEQRFGVTIAISGEPPESGAGFLVERGAAVEERIERSGAIAMAEMPAPEPEEAPAADEEVETEADLEGGRERGRRRRRRRRGNGDDRPERHLTEGGRSEEAEEEESGREERGGDETAEASEAEQASRRRRRGRRGGRRRGGRGREGGDGEGRADTRASDSIAERHADRGGEDSIDAASEEIEAAAQADDDRGPQIAAAEPDAEGAGVEAAAVERSDEAGASMPEMHQPDEIRPDEQPARGAPETAQTTPAEEPVPQPIEDDRPKRSGWWSRRSSFF